ncbi:MAG TPA: hypothetical protein VG994_02640 [Steroidobacteraceae bacterium]|nr:hypothetical protein [Steroidobacteraceae bacterium]
MSENLISKGRHMAIPRSIQFGFAGEDDKPQAVIQFEITGEADPYATWTISAFCFLHEKSWERSIESFRHMGWQGDDLRELPELCAQGLLNEVEIVVDHEVWENEVQAKVKWINKPGGGAVKLKKPMEGAALDAFANRMRGAIRTVPANGARPQQKPAAPKHPNAPDSDIPF